MAQFRVLYDFSAVEEGELSVRSGQVVVLKDGSAPQDGWAEVYVASAPERVGFVPFDYVAPLSGDFGGAGALPEHALPSAASRSAADAVGIAASAASASASSSSSTAAAAPLALNAAEEFGQLFSSHEAWFKSAAAKRQEVYAALKAEAADVLRALRESEAKSASVLSRIAELDGLVAAERQRFQGPR